jgi:hypothetical protein
MQRRAWQRTRKRTRERTQGGATARLLLRLAALATVVLTATGWSPAPPAAGAAPPGDAYAVIVHPLVPTSGVTLPQLRALFLGTRHTWDGSAGGAPVVLIVQAPDTRTGALVLRALYQMDEGAFKRYWIARTFGGADGGDGAAAAGPTLVASDAMARRLTASIPGAVAVVPAAEVDRGVRVLRVDGRLPGADGYALTGAVP